MAAYTSAYSEFLRRLNEVSVLNGLAKKHSVQLAAPKDAEITRATCRASIVLLSSHVEGYVGDLVEVVLERIFKRRMPKNSLAKQFLYYFSRDIVNEIRDSTDPERIAEKVDRLFKRDADIWSTSDIFNSQLSVDRFLGNFSNPTFESIRKLLARFGYAEYMGHLQAELRGDCLPCINMINNVVNQRNKIAHGDTGLSSTPGDIDKMSELIRRFCRATDRVVGTWFKRNGCAIR